MESWICIGILRKKARFRAVWIVAKAIFCPIFSCVIVGDLSKEMHDCKEVLGKDSIFDRLLAHKGKNFNLWQ